MARDSSPFAQRFKALTKRPARTGAQDAASGDTEAAPADASATAPADSSVPTPGPTVPPVMGEPIPTGAHPAASAPDQPLQETDDMPEDEQPTGEFPAIDPSAAVTPPSPVPDAPLDPRATTDAPGAWPPPAAPPSDAVPATPIGTPDPSWTEQDSPDQGWTDQQDGTTQGSGSDRGLDSDPGFDDVPTGEADDQPTTQMPALSPIWLDPPAYEQAPPTDSGAVEWSSPAEDVFEPVSPQASQAPYAPIWEQEFEPADTGADTEPSTPPLRLDVAPDLAPAPTEGAAPTGDVTPAWIGEVEDERPAPTGAVPPPPRGDVDAPSSEPQTPVADAGPTLSPPVLPTPRSTPSALDEALRLDDEPDHDAASEAAHDTAEEPESPVASSDDAAAVATETTFDDARADGPTAAPPLDAGNASDAEPDTQSTQIQDAIPAPPRRGWRSAFGKRKDGPAPADPTGDVDDTTMPTDDARDVVTSAGDADAADAADGSTVDLDRTPDAGSGPTSPDAGTGPTSLDAEAHADDTTSVDLAKDAPRTAGPDGAPVDAAEPPSSTNEGLAPADGSPAADDPSNTGRFAAIGRLGKIRKARRTEPEPPHDATGEVDADAARRAQAEQAEQAEGGAAPEPEPVAALVTEQPPLKPSFTERAALRRRAKSLRARRDAGLIELGAIVLDQSRFGDPTAGTLVRRRTAELADLDNEIAAIEAVLEEGGTAEAVAQLGVVHCTSCSALIGPADRFCVHCGTARPSASDAPDGPTTA